MSHLLDRLNFLTSLRKDTFADGHGQTTIENCDWEDVYRRRWQHDKIVRSTHGGTAPAPVPGKFMSNSAS